MNDIYQRCVGILQQHPEGRTYDELSDDIPTIKPQQIAALKRLGLIFPWGRRLNYSGRKAHVWKATEA